MFSKLIISPAINNSSLLRIFLYLEKDANIVEVKKSELATFFTVADVWDSNGIVSNDNEYICWEIPNSLLPYLQSKFFKNGKYLRGVPKIEFLSIKEGE